MNGSQFLYLGRFNTKPKENNRKLFFFNFNEVHTHTFGYRFAHIGTVSTESKKGVSVYKSLELVL